MPDKIITQRAQGYGNQPVTVTVQINNVTVLEGSVPTQDIPPPALPDFWTPELGVDAWSWAVDSEFVGSQVMTVTVNNGQMYLCDTFFSLSDQPGNLYPLIFEQSVSGVEIGDPLTAVSINGIDQNPVRDPSSAGQWVWQLQSGDRFSCNVNIVPYTSPAEPA